MLRGGDRGTRQRKRQRGDPTAAEDAATSREETHKRRSQI